MIKFANIHTFLSLSLSLFPFSKYCTLNFFALLYVFILLLEITGHLHRSAAHSEEKKRERKGSERKREKEAERSILVEKRTLDQGWENEQTVAAATISPQAVRA